MSTTRVTKSFVPSAVMVLQAEERERRLYEQIAACQTENTRLVEERRKFEAQSLETYLARAREWSQRTFGPGCRTMGVTRHIEKEISEVRQKPEDLSEWIDIIILALDGYWRHGGLPENVARDLFAKMEKNMARQWPAPNSEDEPVEHIRR